MKTTARLYPLPNKNHDVVDDINDLRTTFAMIDADAHKIENEIAKKSETVTNLKNRTVHSSSALKNPEIQKIAPNRFVVVNASGDGFECLDGGGDAGGNLGQVSIKKTDANFDTAWGNLLDVSKNGMTVQENSATTQSNETHIFADVTEIKNEVQLPKVEVTNLQSDSNFVAENNESVILRDEFEENSEEVQVATNVNLGVVKVGDGFTVEEGVLSTPVISIATTEKAGIIKSGEGIMNNSGVISREEIKAATFSNFGVVKLGAGLAINSAGEMEIGNMANAATIYDLGNKKICNNGIIGLEEQTLIYRVFVTEDLLLHFEYDFEPHADFSFVLEIVSDGRHLISFEENLSPRIVPLPVNRGITKINVTKKIGVPHYDVEISRLDAPEPVLLTAQSEARSKFLITTPKGGNWNPTRLLRDYYDGYCDVQEVLFEFFTLVSVDYVKYWSRSSTVAMKKFMLQGSIDGKNWTTLLYKENEICYGKVYTDIKGCFRYFKLTIGYTGDDNKPGGVMLFGTEIDNNDFEVTNLTPYMSSDTTAFATATASKISSGSAANLTDGDVGTYMRVTSSTSEDVTQKGRWIKYELTTPGIANLLELNFTSTNTQANWFKLEGSNDDATWDLLLERQYQTNQLFNNGYRILYVHFQNETEYKFYKLTCIATNDSGDNWDLTGFKLFSKRKIEGKFNFYRGVPKLTEASQDGYEVSASSACDGGHAAKYAFDDNTQTRWATSSGAGDLWLKVKLPNPAVFNAAKIAPRGDNYLDQAPKNFEIQGSDDGETWNTLLSRTDEAWTTLGELRLFKFENETPYLYYRLFITANQGSNYKGCSCFILGRHIYEYRRRLDKYDNVVPTMTSDTTTAEDGVYKLSSSTEHSEHKRIYLFDKKFDTRFELSGETSGWIQVELPMPKFINVFCVGARSDSWCRAAPRNYTLLGSNDGTSWANLFSIFDSSTFSASELRTHELSHTVAYKFYRLNISNPAESVLTFARWDLIKKELIQEY